MVGSTGKGSRNERKLVKWFLNRGWFAIRAGSSGAGGDQSLPDVLAVRNGSDGRSYALAIELKSWSNGKGTLKKADSEVADLREIANRSGAEPLVVVWPDMRKSEHDGRYVVHADDLNENSKSYSVRNSELEDAELLESVISEIETVMGDRSNQNPSVSIWGE
jgi:Holliday junction resolvase